MGSIEQVFDEVKDAVGDKGFIVIIAGLAGLFIYLATKGGSSETATTGTMVAYSSYPDATTNANVIIDSLQNSIDASTQDVQIGRASCRERV